MDQNDMDNAVGVQFGRRLLTGSQTMFANTVYLTVNQSLEKQHLQCRSGHFKQHPQRSVCGVGEAQLWDPILLIGW